MRKIARPTLLRQTSCWCCLFVAFAPSAFAQDGPLLELGSPVGGGVKPAAQKPESLFVVGRLERVRKNNNGGTRMALLDENGQVAAFVSPTARFDLRQFIGKEIGITATTFSQTDGAPPYLLVDKIMPMFASDWNAAAAGSLTPPPTAAPAAGQFPRSSPFPQAGQFRQASPFPQASRVQQASHEQPVLRSASNVRPTQHGEVVFENGGTFPGSGEWQIAGDETFVPNPVCDSCHGYGCADCAVPYHGANCRVPDCTICRVEPATCGPPGWLWFRGEYLAWWAKGMQIPPLVTTSPAGTAATDAGVLPGAEILYGNQEILEGGQSGYRLRFGGFFGPQRRWGYEVEYFGLDDNMDVFSASSEGDGTPILARPFFNLNPRINGDGDLDPPARNDAELVSYPGILAGTVEVESYSEFQSAAAKFRWNLCCNCCNTGCGGCSRCGYPPSSRLDFLLGYRYYGLDEGLRITEDLDSIVLNSPANFEIFDSFTTANDFNGAELGVAWEGVRNRWSLEMMMNVAIGGTRQQVTIDGETTISPRISPSETYEGGLLAQRTNIGSYERTEFSMIPQINANLGFYMTPRLRALVGYNLIYWGNVVRPGDQIDLEINPDLLPPEMDPFVGPERPQFAFDNSDYWIQGLNVGLDYRW